MRYELIKKIYIEGSDELKSKFKTLKYVQKYLTPEELQWINDNCKGTTLSEKIADLKKISSDNISKKKKVVVVKRKKKPTEQLSIEEGKKQPTYRYKGLGFFSKAQLAYYMYAEKNGLNLTINTDKNVYKFFNKDNYPQSWTPFFKLDGKYLDVKQSCDASKESYWPYKKVIAKREGIIIVSEKEMTRIIKKLYNERGSKVFQRCKVKTEKDFKREVVKITSEDQIKDLYERRNDNIKVSFICKRCGEKDFQSVRTVLHFGNMVCKRCRRKESTNLKKSMSQGPTDS